MLFRSRPDLAEDLIAARHKPTRALYEVSAAINEFPIGDQRIVGMDKSTTVLCDAMGSSERIFSSPVPRFYTRHTSRFLELWIILIPLALYEPFGYCWNHWAMYVPYSLTLPPLFSRIRIPVYLTSSPPFFFLRLGSRPHLSSPDF